MHFSCKSKQAAAETMYVLVFETTIVVLLCLHLHTVTITVDRVAERNKPHATVYAEAIYLIFAILPPRPELMVMRRKKR